MTEIWKDIEGYEGFYQVSNKGRVKSLGNNEARREKILKPKFSQKGYLFVGLYKEGKAKNFKIHRLVAQEFIPNPNSLPQVNHKNEQKDDNRLENLEWISAKDNLNYGTRNERIALSNTNGKKSISVSQFDMNGNFIREWVSSIQVKRELKISNSSIVQCCNGKRKSAGGFKWEYAK